MRSVRRLSLLLVSLAPAVACAQMVFTCPDSVSLANPQLAPGSVVAPFGGSVSNEPLALSGLQVFDGPPEQRAVLKPLTTQKHRGQERAKWRFQGDFAAGKWFACNYAQGLASLSTRLPDAVSSCFSQTNEAAIKGRLEVSLRCE